MAANTHSLDLESSSSQYASIADGSQTGLDITGDFTIACWLRLENNPGAGTTRVIVSKNDSGSSQRGFLFATTDDGVSETIIAQISSDGGSTNRDRVHWNTNFVEGQYYFVVLTCDVSNGVSTQFELLIDNVSQGNGTADQDGSVTSIFNNTAPFAIGCDFSSGSAQNFWDGLVDEVVVTSDLLTASEVNQLYLGRDATEILDNLKGYWKLNNAYTDSSGNGNTLTATGSPVFSSTVPFANYYVSESGGGVIFF